MLFTISAETQKWFDQNHTSRSTKPISAFTAALMRAMISRLTFCPRRIGLRRRRRFRHRHRVGVVRLRLLHRSHHRGAGLFLLLADAQRDPLGLLFLVVAEVEARACRAGQHAARRRSARRPACRVRRAARRADRTRSPRSSPRADPSRTDARPARPHLSHRVPCRNPQSPPVPINAGHAAAMARKIAQLAGGEQPPPQSNLSIGDMFGTELGYCFGSTFRLPAW